MIVKGVGGKIRRGISRKAAARARVAHTVKYISKNEVLQDASGQRLRFTNMESDAPEAAIAAMESWKTLRPSITDPVRHIIISPEAHDRPLTREDWQKAIDIYREKRGLGDAPYLAQVELDEHETGRHPQHLHLVFIRVKSSGEPVPDSLDARVNFQASREIEAALGLIENAGKDKMFNGASRAKNRDRAAERAGLSPAESAPDLEKIQQAIAESASAGQLFHKLKEQGIEAQFARRGGDENAQVVGWKLRQIDGPPEWTSGSKLDQDSSLSWGKVEARLAQNRVENTQARLDKLQAIHPHGPRRARVPAAAGQPPRRAESLDAAVERAAAEGLEYLKQILGMLAQRPASQSPRLALAVAETEARLAQAGADLDALPAKIERDELFKKLDIDARAAADAEVQAAKKANEEARENYIKIRDATAGLKFNKLRHGDIPKDAPDRAERLAEAKAIGARSRAYKARDDAWEHYKDTRDRAPERRKAILADLREAAGFLPDSERARFEFEEAQARRIVKQSGEKIDEAAQNGALRRHLKKVLGGDTSTVLDVAEKRATLTRLEREHSTRARGEKTREAAQALAQAQAEQARLQEVRRQQQVAREAARAARRQ